MLTVVSVAFPMAPVGSDAVGGAEQVLSMLDRGLTARGHRSVVIACQGSRAAGRLVPIPRAPAHPDGEAVGRAHYAVKAALLEVLASQPVDLVHFHGMDFHRYLPPAGVPALATLHLPPSWYPVQALVPERPRTWVQCVSRSQQRDCPPSPALVGPIPNGVRAARATRDGRLGEFVISLGRICPEKGFHLALDAARRAGRLMLLAGRVFPYEAHERYFADLIAPRLDRRRRFIGPVGSRRKRRLLRRARCLLAPSQVPETSSLVAMEALACGTPVVAWRRGALEEIVEPGRTGFLVDSVDQMAEAIEAAGELDRHLCRAVARERFSADRMTGDYLALYQELIGRAGPG